MAKKINSKAVELFLLENTDFFISRESLVSELSFKHASEGTSSLLEMQVRKLRNEQSRLIETLTNFLSTGKDNEELFFKSKDLTLSLISSKDFNEVKKTVESFFIKNFKVDACCFEIMKDKDLKNLENETGLEMNKDIIHMGPFSKEKMISFFQDGKIKSGVISVLKLKNGFGLLKIGSLDQAKYLGDGDTAFIEYIRDIIGAVLGSKNA